MVPINRSCGINEKTADAQESLAMDQVVLILTKAAELPGKGPLAMAAMLIALSNRLNRVNYILLIPRTLREFGLSRTTAYRSLVQLETLGLVRVSRHKGQGPLVSLMPPSDDAGAT